MLLELALPIVTTFACAWKATDIDEDTLNTLRKAYGKHADAIYEFQVHKEKADKSLNKLVNRKRALLSGRMTQFISVYQEVRKIDFRPGAGIIELYSDQFAVNSVDEINEMAVTSMKPMTEKELFVTYLISPLGMGGTFLKESKRNAEIANNQLKIADTLSSQADLLIIAVDAIAQRAEQFSNLLSKFGSLFGECINRTEQIIQKNGTNRANYSEEDMKVLANCVNLAMAIKAVLDAPILSEDGSVTEASLAALQEGEHRLQEFQAHV